MGEPLPSGPWHMAHFALEVAAASCATADEEQTAISPQASRITRPIRKEISFTLLPPKEDFLGTISQRKGGPSADLPHFRKHAAQWDRAFVSHPENSLAAVGSHARRTGPMAEVTGACDRDHGSFCRRL